MIQRTQYSHKVYWKSLEEYEGIRIMASMDGMGHNISAWIRDLVVAERARRGLVGSELKKFTPTTKQLIPNESAPHDLRRLVPHPDTGLMVPASSISVLVGAEEKKESIKDILSEFDSGIVDPNLESKGEEGEEGQG